MKLSFPILIAIIALSIALLALAPVAQDPGQQVTLFDSVSITTTTQTAVTPCGQGNGSIGRKTLSAINGSGGGKITVTAELRNSRTGENFTSAYLAINGLAAAANSSDTTTPSETAGAFCQVSIVSASTSTATVVLRRE